VEEVAGKRKRGGRKRLHRNRLGDMATWGKSIKPWNNERLFYTPREALKVAIKGTNLRGGQGGDAPSAIAKTARNSEGRRLNACASSYWKTG